MNSTDLVAAIDALAACDHFDESRRAARDLPDDLDIVRLLRAADGATRLAHDLDTTRRTRPAA